MAPTTAQVAQPKPETTARPEPKPAEKPFPIKVLSQIPT
jgi:hypothetical protein